jgi:hypothetical protein
MMLMPTKAMRTSSLFRTLRCIRIKQGAGIRRGEGARPPLGRGLPTPSVASFLENIDRGMRSYPLLAWGRSMQREGR